MSEIYSLLPIGEELRKFHSPIFAYAFYKNRKVNLLTGESETFSLDKLQDRYQKVHMDQHFSKPRLIHFFYEWGFFYHELGELIEDEDLLVLDIQYSHDEAFSFSKLSNPIALNNISSPLFETYQKSFSDGYEALLRGDCYQFNLTFPYQFKLGGESSVLEIASRFLSKAENRGSFAHLTWLGPLAKGFMSNSPECLFKIDKLKEGFLLESMPIKGSIHLPAGSDGTLEWQQLKASQKDENELNIITDLIRNDLSKIEKPLAIVKEMREPLKVPSILHQYSRVQVELSSEVSLGQIMKAIFPGGSVTGAPKRRVLKILRQLEERSRGFYCGSTVLLYEHTLAASINIRSAELDLLNKGLSYQAGGGITLLSEAQAEYEEMRLKVQSLVELLTNSMEKGS